MSESLFQALHVGINSESRNNETMETNILNVYTIKQYFTQTLNAALSSLEQYDVFSAVCVGTQSTLAE